MSKKKFSCVLPVYHGTTAKEASRAIESVLNQSLTPDEVIIAVDGPVSIELKRSIEEHASRNSRIKIISSKENLGLAKILNLAIDKAKYQYIARMDSDDFSLPNRFERQLHEIEKNNLDIVGTAIKEVRTTGARTKSMPVQDHEIKSYAKMRNPFNHPTVMFKKKLWEDLNGYADLDLFEDYDLWLRILNSGARSKNLNEPLVEMSMEYDDFRRRHGLRYARNEIRFAIRQIGAGTFTVLGGIAFLLKRLPLRLVPYVLFERIIGLSRK